MEATNDPDVSGEFPLARIFDHTRFPNLDQQINLPYTSTGSSNHYDQAQNFQAHAPNDGYQVAEQPMRPHANYCQPQNLQAQAPNGGYQVTGPPVHSQAAYGQAQGYQAPFENRGHDGSAEGSQLEAEPTRMDDETHFHILMKSAAKVHKTMIKKKENDFVAYQTATKAQLECRNAEIIRLQNGERNRMEEIKKLNEKVKELDSGYNDSRHENRNLNAKLVELEREKQLLTDTVREQELETQTLRDQFSQRERLLEQSNVQTAALSSTLADKDVEINQLNTNTNSLRGELAAEKEEKQRLETELATLKQEYENCKAELAKKKKTNRSVQQNFVMVTTEVFDATQKTVSQRNGEEKKSVKRRIPTIDIDSNAQTMGNDRSEQEEVHSTNKAQGESFKRKRNVKIQMACTTTRYCDADDSSKNNGPSHT